MYCITLSILPYQLFNMFNDFNDLETFRASDKRTSSDFKNISNTWIYLKLLQAIMDIVPAPLKQLYHICCSLAYTRVGRENLQNLIWDEVPTMVEIAIFWFQIHITNGLNFIHRKWYTGNNTWLYLQKIGCAVIWNYFLLLMLKGVPDISRP